MERNYNYSAIKKYSNFLDLYWTIRIIATLEPALRPWNSSNFTDARFQQNASVPLPKFHRQKRRRFFFSTRTVESETSFRSVSFTVAYFGLLTSVSRSLRCFNEVEAKRCPRLDARRNFTRVDSLYFVSMRQTSATTSRWEYPAWIKRCQPPVSPLPVRYAAKRAGRWSSFKSCFPVAIVVPFRRWKRITLVAERGGQAEEYCCGRRMALRV